MITATQKEQIINVLGKQYSPAIITYLEKKEIKPVRSDAFTPKIIQDIMAGNSENIEAEFAIMELVDKTKKTLQKLEQKKSKLTS